jgi:hypothetical protein
MNIHLGRHVYGLAAIAFGVIAYVFHDFNGWQQAQPLAKAPHLAVFVLYFAAAIEILGGITIQWSKTARVGALMLGGTYLVFVLLWVPRVIASPLNYDPWGNVFEQSSLVSGAILVYAAFKQRDAKQAARIARIGYIAFGICVISFTLEQVFFLPMTASAVPKWIPPGQMFWAVATTIFFALAAMALLSGRFALFASRLLTLMIIGFGLLVWLPALFADPHKLFNWGGNAQNLAIAGSAWIVTDFLAATGTATGTVTEPLPNKNAALA